MLEYQKSVGWHAPHLLLRRSRTTGIEHELDAETMGGALLWSLHGWVFID
jgi:hypothetical protein